MVSCPVDKGHVPIYPDSAHLLYLCPWGVCNRDPYSLWKHDQRRDRENFGGVQNELRIGARMCGDRRDLTNDGVTGALPTEIGDLTALITL